MRANEFITERKKKRRAYGGYFYPGYGYTDNSSGDGGGDGGGGESVNESPEVELAKRLPSLAKHDYNTIDDLMRKIAKKHKITSRALSDLFKKKYRNTPDSWIKGKLDESLPNGASKNVRRPLDDIIYYIMKRMSDRTRRRGDPIEHNDYDKLFTQVYAATKGTAMHKEYSLVDLFKMDGIDKSLLYAIAPMFRNDWVRPWDDNHNTIKESITSGLDIEKEVEKFVDWTAKKLNLKKVPKIELSMDTEEAQTNHHTGGHVPGEDSIWVYANNRNLVDILRTVFHELVHVRQHEIGMIKPGDSYPGSPIEAMADMLAGKYMKIYGEKNNHIFQ
jgi:hypothetical protein